jgi:hypothetical protein
MQHVQKIVPPGAVENGRVLPTSHVAAPMPPVQPPRSTEERRRFVYRHVQFNHALRTPGQLLEEHGDSRWELVRIVPYDSYESVLVLRREDDRGLLR